MEVTILPLAAFTLGDCFAATIHVCLYSHNCYNSGSNVVHMDNTAVLKCNDCRMKPWLAGHLDKGIVHWRGSGM